MTQLEFGILLMIAANHDFRVDVRSVYPIMIKGQMAKKYHSSSDLDEFLLAISKGDIYNEDAK